MTLRTLIALALLALAPIAAADRSSAPVAEVPSWSAVLTGVPTDGGAPLPLTFVRASFEVDVLGPLAVGVLVQEFANESSFDVAATYSGKATSGIRVSAIEVERDGEIEELTPPEQANDTKSKTPSRKSRLPQKARSLPSVPVAGGESVTIRAIFEMPLPIVEGHFMLELPGVTASAAPGAGQPVPIAGSINVHVHHDEPLIVADSETHDVFVTYHGDHSLVELAEGEPPSRPFKLELGMGAENDPDLMGFVGPETEDGTRDVIMVLAPPAVPRDGTIRAKQVSFVLDTSGSMANGKLEEARGALAGCLGRLRGEDAFNIYEFDSEFTAMSPAPVVAAEAAVHDAVRWMSALSRGGGTQLLPALEAALDQPETGDRHRMVVILTDGAMQDRQAVLSLLEQSLGDTRLFVVGIGADVQHETIRTIAAFGRGTAAFAEDPAGLNAAVTALFDSVSDPLAWDVAVDWQGADVEWVEPKRIPDLYAGRPVTIRARVRGDVPPELMLQASTTEGTTSFTARVPDSDSVMPRFARPKAPKAPKAKSSGSRPGPDRR